MIRTLLLAHDFSPSSERALRHAVDLVERTGATLHLLYVKEVPLGPMVKGDPSPMAGEKKLLEDLRAKLREHCRSALEAHDLGPDAVQYHAERSGAVAPSIVRAADRTEADLIAMGTQGHRGLQRAFFGSVARETLRTAPCPVLTVRALPDEEEPAAEPAAGPPVERVVVPVDFSDPSRQALAYAGRVASLYDVPLKLVHVVEQPRMPAVYEVESPKISGRKVKARAERALEEWGAELRADGRPVSFVVHRGEPASLILEAAPEASDLLVMATRGLSGVQRTFLGSVAEQVVCEAVGPVLVGRTFPTDP